MLDHRRNDGSQRADRGGVELGGWFVDRHFYLHDHGGRGRYATWTRGAQLRLLATGLLGIGLLVGLAALAGYGWSDRFAGAGRSMATPAFAAVPAAGGGDEETAALRAALNESRQKRAELAARVESLERRSAVTGPSQADLDDLQARYDDVQASLDQAVADRDAAAARAEAAKRDAARTIAANASIDPASVPDRVRALELELEMVQAERPPEPVLAEAAPAADPLDQAFTDKEEQDARRIEELQATVAELEAERDMLDAKLARLTAPSDGEPDGPKTDQPFAAGADTKSGAVDPSIPPG